MKLPLSKEEYALLQKSAEKHGLTVDQEVQVALLYYFKKHDPAIFEAAKKGRDPEVLQVLEREAEENE